MKGLKKIKLEKNGVKKTRLEKVSLKGFSKAKLLSPQRGNLKKNGKLRHLPDDTTETVPSSSSEDEKESSCSSSDSPYASASSDQNQDDLLDYHPIKVPIPADQDIGAPHCFMYIMAKPFISEMSSESDQASILQVSNIGFCLKSEAILKRIFMEYGTVFHIEFGANKDTAFIHFEDSNSIRKALSAEQVEPFTVQEALSHSSLEFGLESKTKTHHITPSIW